MTDPADAILGDLPNGYLELARASNVCDIQFQRKGGESILGIGNDPKPFGLNPMQVIEHPRLLELGRQKVLFYVRRDLGFGPATGVCDQLAPFVTDISPLLANVFLHYVFDLWVQQWRRRHSP